MVSKCIYVNCKNTTKNCSKSFFTFPQNNETTK